MTNYERIKEMSEKEMAEFFFIHDEGCKNCCAKKFCESSGEDTCLFFIQKWLKSEVEE